MNRTNLSLLGALRFNGQCRPCNDVNFASAYQLCYILATRGNNVTTSLWYDQKNRMPNSRKKEKERESREDMKFLLADGERLSRDRSPFEFHSVGNPNRVILSRRVGGRWRRRKRKKKTDITQTRESGPLK